VVTAIFSAYALAITAAMYASWDSLKIAPWPLQMLAVLMVALESLYG
jgi:hypothetical protein